MSVYSDSMPLIEGEVLNSERYSLQQKVLELRETLKSEINPEEIERINCDIKEYLSKIEKLEAELRESQAVSEQISQLRQSSRERRPTPKMLEYMQQEAAHRERKFNQMYIKWKTHTNEVRMKLKQECTEDELSNMMDAVEKHELDMKTTYEELRSHTVPSQDIKRKIDTCTAITADLLGLMRIRSIENDFDAETERTRLLELYKRDYAKSVYGSTVSRVASSSKHSSHLSKCTSTSAKRVEASAQLAAKRAEIEMEAVIEAQRQQLKKLKNQRDIEVIEAKLKVYAEEEIKENGDRSRAVLPERTDPCPSIPTSHHSDQGNVAAIAQAIHETMVLTRLPTPEPTVFSGDPLKFIEWSTSFEALIARRCSNPADKLFYLQKYVSGEAKSALEGSFYRKDEEAFKQAWEKLNTRYGHPFVVQRAFRERLNSWPKIGSKEYVRLREYGDFLQACSNAIPHIKGLQVLNDCEENQKMLLKLPDWVTSRWNRHVTKQLDQGKEYPSFEEFSSFVNSEARIACNPVSSLHILKPLEGKPTREIKRAKVTSFAVDTMTKDHDTNESKTKVIDVLNREKARTESHTPLQCMFCGENHSIYKCQQMKERPVEEKKRFILDNQLCFGCLRKGHSAKDCKRRATCGICKGRHPTPLHEDRPKRDRASTHSTLIEGEIISTLSCCMVKSESKNTSMIIPVCISSPGTEGKEVLAYALLDTQSSNTFIDQEVCEKLQVAMEPVKLKLSTIMGKDSLEDSQRVTGVKVKGLCSDVTIDLPPVYTRDFIPLDREHIPTCETAKKWKHLSVISHEIPPLKEYRVGLLIGYDCSKALMPRQIITGGDDEPYAIKTDLGWSIIGGPQQAASSRQVTGLCHRISVKTSLTPSPAAVIKILESDFADTSSKEKSISQEDITFLHILEGGIQQNQQGHLEMPLPFKKRPDLPYNRNLALVRLRRLERKLGREPKFKGDYSKFMEGIIQDGDAERADHQPDPGKVWYIPHQGVYHLKKPDKIRVVFDCSARYDGVALNDYLLTGPDLTNMLSGVLSRFRKYPIAVMCDIEKMFHRFHVKEEDRDFLRFLWWENGNTNTEPVEYRMKVHLFGAASSPGCANYGMKHLANQNEGNYPSAANFIKKNFYVDDGLVSLQSADSAIKLVKETQELCAKGNLRLHKFISNSREVLESICESERASAMENVDLNYDDLPVQNALGLRWDVENDEFFFKVSIEEKPATRRNILSTVASVYDPLGFLAPVILRGKGILQELCRQKLGWDDSMPEELRPRWESWIKDLQHLHGVRIPRCFAPHDFGKYERIELHHFSDASSYGYGQCSYIRVIRDEKVHCSLVMAKTRVAPTNVLTIPRLELSAAVVSASVSKFLRDELEFKVDEEYFWTDSQVVLGYINNEARRFHVFVANRVQRIREITDPDQWYYIESERNPADHASRGLKVSEMKDSNWFTGPKFLWEREIVPIKNCLELSMCDPEVKVIQALNTTTKCQDDMLERLSRFSNWTTVVNVVARIQRLARRTRKFEPLNVEERMRAEDTVIKLIHQKFYKEELKMLSQEPGRIPNNHPLHQLNLILQDGIIRVGGRLENAPLSFRVKHPAILPKDSTLTSLIIDHHHTRSSHQGRGLTLSYLRDGGYWIVNGSKTVAKHIKQCVLCRKTRRPTEDQRMANLPMDRVEPSPPFSYCGMDCFGPFYTKQDRKEHKRYGLLFTCLSSRAIHIEMLENMSTDVFINALRCFIAIRGTVREIRSDQGSNFVGAKNELRKALEEVDKERITMFLAERQCDFHMNVPDASHTGGVWERQIRTARNVLSSVLKQSAGRIDDASLRTVFYEAMSIVNSRPLTVDNINDPTSLDPLTPNHLLHLKSTPIQPPPGKFLEEDLYARKRWRRVQYLTEQFWNRWRREYLANLTLRQKWHTPRRNVQINDIVIVKEEDIPRNRWRIAKVLEVQKDNDGLVRRVKLQMGDSKLSKRGERLTTPLILERPIQKLVVLIENNNNK
eukprot:XP_017950676.1 PREDICTED: uncharacterized protein LOC101733728 [Xenopus tropicalis]